MDEGVDDIVSIAHKLARVEARSWRPEDQKDLAQDALAKYARHFGPHSSPDEPQAWLRVVIRTTAADISRAREQPVLLPPVAEDGDLLLDVLTLKAVGPSYQVVTFEFLSSILDRLDVAEAQMIRWKYIDGRSADWIGRQTGQSSAAARKSVSRALASLRVVVDGDPEIQSDLRTTMSRWYSE
ncbi:RNA polymerase sigma factor (sigma-70 family) [Aeromicrobium panaciterrae]|uniref:RNA polymerase sigma factor (Sigma-70 family) n=1 Tax=Aeromicrobium panaciterrae TaxID=363861 RepID=A0ABU1UNU6_9ACTN|nr:sigma-70 family RNA polymerase sigma factor [Aeromicrobium panaciterrae]MDR7086853.1 RNA polymerase sigma factor (sigma-70 family) [Aeromicrobium panaciterrae]